MTAKESGMTYGSSAKHVACEQPGMRPDPGDCTARGPSCRGNEDVVPNMSIEPRSVPPPEAAEADVQLLFVELEEAPDVPSGKDVLDSGEFVEWWAGQISSARTHASSIINIKRSFQELGVSSAYIKKYKNKSWVIFKGHFTGAKTTMRSGVRKIFPGPKYSLQNANVVRLGVGPKNAIRAGAGGSVITFVILGTADVVEEFLRDEPSMARLGVKLVVLGAKVSVSAVASAAIAGIGVAVGAPVVAVAAGVYIVGVVVWVGLDTIDKEFNISDWLQREAVEMENDLEQKWWSFWFNLHRHLEWCIMRRGRGCFY